MKFSSTRLELVFVNLTTLIKYPQAVRIQVDTATIGELQHSSEDDLEIFLSLFLILTNYLYDRGCDQWATQTSGFAYFVSLTAGGGVVGKSS